MTQKYRVTRDVSTDECPWLKAPLAADTVLTQCVEAMYGCISPSGRGLTFAEDGGYPFFEVPLSAIEPTC